MITEKRVRLVQELAKRLGSKDDSDQYIMLDRVEGDAEDVAMEGCLTTLSLGLIAGVAIKSMDCRLVFPISEATEEEFELEKSGLAMFMEKDELVH